MIHKTYRRYALYKRLISRAIRGLYYRAYIEKSVSMEVIKERGLIKYHFFDKTDKNKWNSIVFLFYKNTLEIRVMALFPFMYHKLWYNTTIKKPSKFISNKRYEFNEIIKLINI